MQDLQSLEIFEIEVLELLNSIKVLDSVFFGGGTMLRLCHNLNRYSTDLDFWLDINSDSRLIYSKIKEALSGNYRIIDSTNKKYTLLFEFRSSKITRNLKIEIRKEQKDFDWERKIAFSKFSNKQVVVKALSLHQMMVNKTEAFLSRKLIRDCFDIEFLLMRGVEIISEKSKLEMMLRIIDNFKDRDFKITLGSVLDEKDRKFYAENKFMFLQEEIKRKLQ
ncbi:MAG: nucleotidyl transferase AbiEii/AbiGii toxin family protein [Bacteroidetes bacterium]|nr:nucleotidyl transferase AbiEii/AbiGii toxin family protein [Bacteroidota bacterium]